MSHKVSRVQEYTERVTAVLDNIVAHMKDTAHGNEEIATATERQASSSGEVVSMVEEAVDEIELMHKRISTLPTAVD